MVIRVLNIVGARPQLMKACILSSVLGESKRFQEILVHTGQHYDSNMSSGLMRELFTKLPDYQLNSGGKSELEMLSDQVVRIGRIIQEEEPNYVISYGDTTTTLAGALAARKLNVNHVHVEAGVRNYDMHMPEEVNRILVDKISELNFCATKKSVQNLLNEGHQKRSDFSSTIFTGDLMLDCFVRSIDKISRYESSINDGSQENTEYVYVTCHRQSNVDSESKLKEIVHSLNIINAEIPVVLPLHPRTKNMLKKFNLSFSFKTLDPVGYSDSIRLLRNARYVITDSGGIVREAFFARKPSLLLLEEPLWPEIEELKCSISTKEVTQDEILRQYHRLSQVRGDFDVPIFGEGNAGRNIVDAIERHFDGK